MRLLHITDTHLFADADRLLRGVNTRDSLQQVLAAVRRDPEWPPRAVLATGDLSEDESPDSYRAFRALLGPLGLPVHCLAGNHDDPALMRSVLDRAPLGMPRAVTLPGWALVLLCSRVPGQAGGRLDDTELAALQRALAAHRGQHVLICVHHHPVPMGSAWLDRHMIANADAFHRLVASHGNVRGVLWGHVHQSFDETRDGLRLLATPSTCGQFLPRSERFATDDSPPAWRWLDLQPDGRIDTCLRQL